MLFIQLAVLLLVLFGCANNSEGARPGSYAIDASSMSALSSSSDKEPRPLPINDWTGKKVLFIYAHIDDMEGAAGGLASLLSGKAQVSLVILTNSNKGCGNPEICTNKTTDEVAQIRQSEQFNSAAMLGISSENVHILDYEDCLLSTYPEVDVKRKLVGLIRIIQPNIVITWDPASYFDLLASDGWEDLGFHPDHQTSGKLALDSAWIAHEDRLWPDLGKGWRPDELYFFSFNPNRTPDFYVDITGSPVEMKAKAFGEMKSQITPEDAKGMEAYFKLLGARVGQQAKLPADRLAEAFVYVLW